MTSLRRKLKGRLPTVESVDSKHDERLRQLVNDERRNKVHKRKYAKATVVELAGLRFMLVNKAQIEDTRFCKEMSVKQAIPAVGNQRRRAQDWSGRNDDRSTGHNFRYPYGVIDLGYRPVVNYHNVKVTHREIKDAVVYFLELAERVEDIGTTAIHCNGSYHRGPVLMAEFIGILSQIPPEEIWEQIRHERDIYDHRGAYMEEYSAINLELMAYTARRIRERDVRPRWRIKDSKDSEAKGSHHRKDTHGSSSTDYPPQKKGKYSPRGHKRSWEDSREGAQSWDVDNGSSYWWKTQGWNAGDKGWNQNTWQNSAREQTRVWKEKSQDKQDGGTPNGCTSKMYSIDPQIILARDYEDPTFIPMRVRQIFSTVIILHDRDCDVIVCPKEYTDAFVQPKERQLALGIINEKVEETGGWHATCVVRVDARARKQHARVALGEETSMP